MTTTTTTAPAPTTPKSKEKEIVPDAGSTRLKTCRFYENQYPEVDDVVVVKVISIAEMGAYVNLVEYNNIEGMILLSELSRRRIRSINKLIRIDRIEYVVVLRVDKERGYIDLSKRRVSMEEIRKCEEKVSKARAVNSILRHVAEICQLDLERLYEQTAWKLKNTHGTAYEAFKMAVTNADAVLKPLGLEDGIYNTLVENIKLRLTPQPLKIRADVGVSCFEYEGIDAVKRALREGLKYSTEEEEVKINLHAPPKYVITTQSIDKEAGIALVNNVIEAIKNKIEEEKGTLVVTTEPRVTSQEELKRLFDEDGEEEEDEDESEESEGDE